MKVFYLEQNDMMQRSVELALQSKGVEVYTAVPSDDFEHILVDWGADVLLVDHQSVNGEIQRFVSTQIPVVVTSEEEGLKGEFLVVMKPLNPVELASFILEKFGN